MKEFWSSLASLLGVLAFCQSLLHAVFPPELRFAAVKLFKRLFNSSSSYCYFDITEIDGVNTNELYNAVSLYLSSWAWKEGGSRLSLTRAVNSSSTTFGLANNDSLGDSFRGVGVVWEHVVTQRQSQSFSWRPLPEEKRGFTLRMRKKDKGAILNAYLDYIMERASEIRRKSQERFLYTNSGRGGGSLDSRGHPWESVPFKHPSTFHTLAMDPSLKRLIMDDLTDFSDGQSFYHRTGRAWKRGYLLYGPPGTGKSSMIAAMANFLSYDVYDLELTEVHTNSELRKLLMKTTSKSIIVIEDIDCSINLGNRNKAAPNSPSASRHAGYDAPHGPHDSDSSSSSSNSITLSGLLNFTDGLWSCCGSERIFVFTTNHIEKLDPALLRSGRMDMHIFMSYCTFPALRTLLQNYLDFTDPGMGSPVMGEIEAVIDKAQMTPADISEVLIKNRRHKDKALKELLEAMKTEMGKKENWGESSTACRVQKNSTAQVEDEEQEKRALENPKERCDDGEIPEEITWKKEAAEDQDQGEDDEQKLN